MKVVIFQHRLLHYREQLFELLHQECALRGIELKLVHGQASIRERKKKDEGSLTWAYRVANKFIVVGDRDVLWQPVPKVVRDADLFIIMQESRILSNYWLILSRLWSKRKVAYWGHGRNFQSVAPSGFRERWKQLMLTKVDWWFAYTQMTVDILKEAGYDSNCITCLENAIDTSSFKSDLASWSDEALQQERERLNIPSSATVGIFCGSLYPDKRLELLIESADWIRQRKSQFHIIVIGDGPSMEYMRESAASRPWIHLVGVQQGSEKAKYFRLGHIMLNPGLVGLHIVDAFCSGLVMVTTKTARHSPEVAYLRDGINGVYAGDTTEEYGRAVLELIEQPHKMRTMCTAAMADSEKYTLDNMVKRFADGIEAAIVQ